MNFYAVFGVQGPAGIAGFTVVAPLVLVGSTLSFAPSADVPIGGHKLTGLLDPASPQDAATKNYVDAVASGVVVKPSCTAATTGVLPGYTGTATTLTATANGALAAQDGVALTAGQRVLVKNESGANQKFNGIYTVTQAGDSTHPFLLTRPADSTGTLIVSGDFAFVETGTLQAGTGWVLSTPDPITVGTTALAWTQFSGPGAYSAGAGLVLTGTQFSANLSSATPAATTQAGSAGAGTGVARDTHSHPADTIVGQSNQQTTYAGGSIAVPRAVVASTDTPTAADSELELRVRCTSTLSHLLPDGTVFTFWDTTGVATTAAHALVPDGGLLINGQNSYPFARSYGAQTAKKINGAWVAAQ